MVSRILSAVEYRLGVACIVIIVCSQHHLRREWLRVGHCGSKVFPVYSICICDISSVLIHPGRRLCLRIIMPDHFPHAIIGCIKLF